MRRKSTGKKVTRRAPRKTRAKEVPEILKLEQAEHPHPIPLPSRERVIEIRHTETPPVSPYVIDFRTPLTADRLPSTASEGAAPTMAEEFVGEENRKQKVGVALPKLRLPKLHFKLPRIRLPKLHVPKLPVTGYFPTSEAMPPVTGYRLPVTGYRLPPQRAKRRHRLPVTNLRPALAFALIALLFVLPATSLEAYTKVEQTKQALLADASATLNSIALPTNLSELPAALERTRGTLTETKTRLEEAVGIFGSVLPLVPRVGKAYQSGRYLLDAGTHLTEAGRLVADGFRRLSESQTSLTTRLMHLEEALRAAFPLLTAAHLELERVTPSALPTKIRGRVLQFTQNVTAVRSGVASTIELLPSLEAFLGLERTMRYLVVFQNPNELRPTGGFIGSFALIDVDRGVIQILEVPGGGSYDLQGGLREHVIAPEPLHLIEPHWQFHDANWFPDFPTSAKKLIWFYEKSGGPTVDGVIAVNATVVPQLLELFGPIEMPEYGRTFTALNFITETQKIVELEYDRTENKPKKLIGALAPKLLERILTAPPDQFLPLLSILGNALDTKDLQLFAREAELEDAFGRAGWTGAQLETNGDYVQVVSTNIAGGKTSGIVTTALRQRITIDGRGEIVHRLDITRTHHGVKHELFTGVRNVEYIRIYVPAGSELIEARGFERPSAALFDKPDADYVRDTDLVRIATGLRVDPTSNTDTYRELGKTVFGNWMQVDPGASVTASITYRVPQRITFDSTTVRSRAKRLLGLRETAPYTFLIQKQSGFTPTIDTEISFPSTWKVRWSTGGTQSRNTLKADATLTSDTFMGLLFER